MWTGSTRYSENMDVIVFSCIWKFELTWIKQETLNKQGCSHKNTSYEWLVHIFLHNLI